MEEATREDSNPSTPDSKGEPGGPPSEEERQARAAWTAIAQPGEEIVGSVVGHFGPVEALERVRYLARKSPQVDEMTVRTVFEPVALPPSLAQVEGWVMRLRELNLEVEYQLLSRECGSLVIPGDPDWPSRVDSLGAVAPLALWLRGSVSALGRLQQDGAVSVVGARSATRYGTTMAEEIAYELGERGIWVVSGGAYGIDTAAHRGALNAKGKTICVQAGGLGELYPAMNSNLFRNIEETGAIISESPPSQRPAKRLFLTRNRIVAAIAQVVVVVEAGERSGAISTANHGTEQGREVAAVPGAVTSTASVGCHKLIREGATLVTNASEIIELMGPLHSHEGRLGGDGVGSSGGEEADRYGEGSSRYARNAAGTILPPSLFDGLTGDGVKVIDSLSPRYWKTPEQIARAAGLGLRSVQSELGLLELDDKVETLDGRYRLQRVS